MFPPGVVFNISIYGEPEAYGVDINWKMGSTNSSWDGLMRYEFGDTVETILEHLLGYLRTQSVEGKYQFRVPQPVCLYKANP